MHPLVVTLAVDDGTQERFDALRRRWFPAHRLLVPAHVSLFHALPGAHEQRVLADLDDVCARSPFALQVVGVRSLGGGAALLVEATELGALHGALAERWRPLLTPQDRQPLRAHVTVQNKATAAEAQACAAELRRTFVPWTATAVGVDVHRYVGGPWEPVGRVPFDGAAPRDPARRIRTATGSPARLHLRPATAADAGLLGDMLAVAADWRAAAAPRPTAEVLADPALVRYVAGWGRAGDVGVVAKVDGEPVGAAWARRLPADEARLRVRRTEDPRGLDRGAGRVARAGDRRCAPDRPLRRGPTRGRARPEPQRRARQPGPSALRAARLRGAPRGCRRDHHAAAPRLTGADVAISRRAGRRRWSA
jgi:hypothetical protein